MATLDMSLDTSNEDLTVRLNGKKIDGAIGVRCHKYMNYDGKSTYELSVDVMKMDGDDKVSEIQYLTVTKADSRLGKQITAEGRILQKDGDFIYFAKTEV